jgi:hypothetical protein
MSLIRLVGFFALSAALLRPVRFRIWGLDVRAVPGAPFPTPFQYLRG